MAASILALRNLPHCGAQPCSCPCSMSLLLAEELVRHAAHTHAHTTVAHTLHLLPSTAGLAHSAHETMNIIANRLSNAMRWRADARDFLAGTLRKCTIEELDNLMSTIPSLKVKLVEPALVMRVHASAKELQKRVHALARAKSVTMPVLQYVCKQVCLCACSSHGLPSNSTPPPRCLPTQQQQRLAA